MVADRRGAQGDWSIRPAVDSHIRRRGSPRFLPSVSLLIGLLAGQRLDVVVTGSTPDGCSLIFMASNAGLHGRGLLLCQYVTFAHWAVAGFAGKLGFLDMRAMRKEDVVRYLIDLHPGHRFLLSIEGGELPDRRAIRFHGGMTLHTATLGRVSHGPTVGGKGVAIEAVR